MGQATSGRRLRIWRGKLTPMVWDAGLLAGMTSWSRALLHHWSGAAVFAGLH